MASEMQKRWWVGLLLRCFAGWLGGSGSVRLGWMVGGMPDMLLGLLCKLCKLLKAVGASDLFWKPHTRSQT